LVKLIGIGGIGGIILLSYSQGSFVEALEKFYRGLIGKRKVRKIGSLIKKCWFGTS